MLPVFDAVVSNTIPTTLSTQFHSLRYLQVWQAIWGPTLSFDLWGIVGTPSNLIPDSPNTITFKYDIKLSVWIRDKVLNIVKIQIQTYDVYDYFQT